MFGLGIWEILVILVIALVIMGPDRLPTLAKALGRGMREFRKATREIQASLEVEEVRRTVRRGVAVARSPRSAIQKQVVKTLLGDEEKKDEISPGSDQSETAKTDAVKQEQDEPKKDEKPEKGLKDYEELTKNKPSTDKERDSS